MSSGSSMFDLLVRRPVAAWMLAIAAAVFGMVSYGRLSLDLMPDLSYPTITVRTEVPGYAPEEVESQISRPIEEALSTTEGLIELESRSRAGMSDVVLEFDWGADMDKASQSLRERLQTTWLPDDAARPLILRYDPSLDPVMRLALSRQPDASDGPRGDEGLYQLRELAERQLKRDLEALDGIAAVRVRGGLQRQVWVEVREDWMAGRGVTIDQVTATLGAENINMPGGVIREGEREYLVRTLNELKAVDEIGSLEIPTQAGGRVRIDEVATVRQAHKDREVITELDGEPAVELEIYKAADANVVRVAERLSNRLGLTPWMGPPEMAPRTLKDALPAWVSIVVLDDQAAFIEAALSNLANTVMLGALLAVLVLYLFLRDFRATGIIALAIPLSIICTFAPMYLGGVSLNLMSLGGLALGVGMLVDNAVVVLESIQVKVEQGSSRMQASVEGTREVAAAVIASTLTTVSVFLPIAFVEGVAGQVFGDLSMAVVFSLLASLVTALFFVPVLAATEWQLDIATLVGFRQVSRSAEFKSIGQFRSAWGQAEGWRRGWLPYWGARLLLRLFFEVFATVVSFVVGWAIRLSVMVFRGPVRLIRRGLEGASVRFGRGYDRFAEWAGRLLHHALDRPMWVLGLAGVVVLFSVPAGGALGQALLPEVHQGRFTAEVALPVGTPLGRTHDVVTQAQGIVGDHPEVAHVHLVVGTEQRADSRADEGEHTARMLVELTPGGNLERREAAVMKDVREALMQLPEAEFRLVRPSLFSLRTPVEVVVFEQDLERLKGLADRVAAALSGVVGLEDVTTSLVPGYPEVRVRYDRQQLARFGLETGGVAQQVRNKIQGQVATAMSRAQGRLDLVVRLDESDRRTTQDIRDININPAVTPSIPLSAVATFEDATGPSEIRRIDQRRAATVTANVQGFDLSGQGERIRWAMMEMGDAILWELGGQNAEMERSLSSMRMALLLAVFLVYVIMASTFESVVHPFVILFSLPLALVGVVLSLFVVRLPVSVSVLIGGIVLAGVVVNNAIVLVDTINRLRRGQNLDRVAAIRQGTGLRLRPILITATTTVLGLLPLALGFGEGAEVQRPLAITVIAGLSSATVLTLVVIPVVYLVVTGFLEQRGLVEPEK